MAQQTAKEKAEELMSKMLWTQRHFDELIEQAKAMEKEQIIHSFNEGMSNSFDYFANGTDESEQYYNKTYNK